MSYCSHCGAEINDEAVICPKCGCAVKNVKMLNQPKSKKSGLKIITKIFMIAGYVPHAVLLAIALNFAITLSSPAAILYSIMLIIPLIWCIPITITYFYRTKNNQPINTGFKVCYLLFVNLIAGILMLCNND